MVFTFESGQAGLSPAVPPPQAEGLGLGVATGELVGLKLGPALAEGDSVGVGKAKVGSASGEDEGAVDSLGGGVGLGVEVGVGVGVGVGTMFFQ